MLKIRLQRVGRVHEPSYRLVLTDSKNSTKSGKYIENLGNYDSRKAEKANFKTDRIKHWLERGAQASTTVHNLILNLGVISGKKINALPLKKPIKKEGEVTAQVETKAETQVETKLETEAQTTESPVATPNETEEEVKTETVETPVA